MISRPKLKLIGEDGNAFFIMGRAIKTARMSGWPDAKIDKLKKELTSGDYNNLLATCAKYFKIY
jgi:hypothetical protein